MIARRFRPAVPALGVALALTAASLGAGVERSAAAPTGAPDDTTETTTNETTSTEQATTTTIAEPTEMPLTGRPLADGETVPRRGAIVVKIDNAPAARPQTGLNQADIVFEEIVEGDITRFAAVFHSQGANPVGPVRSGRTQDVDLLSWLGAPIFVWSGGNPGVTRAIDESDFVSVPDGTRDFFYRSGERRRPHNLFANTDPIWDHYAWSIYPPPSFVSFVDEGEEAPGTPTDVVELRMGGIPVRWEYDPAMDHYARSQQGRVHELVDGPATADNVIVLLTGYRRSVADSRSPEAITVGEGIAYVLSDGTLQIGRWARPASTSTLTLETTDGEPILVGRGRTWVELADRDRHDTTTTATDEATD